MTRKRADCSSVYTWRYGDASWRYPTRAAYAEKVAEIAELLKKLKPEGTA